METEGAKVRASLGEYVPAATLQLTRLRDTIQGSLAELEAHYYDSVCRVSPSNEPAHSSDKPGEERDS